EQPFGAAQRLNVICGVITGLDAVERGSQLARIGGEFVLRLVILAERDEHRRLITARFVNDGAGALFRLVEAIAVAQAERIVEEDHVSALPAIGVRLATPEIGPN